MRTTIKIPIRPYLSNFIRCELGQKEEPTIYVDSKSPIGSYLMGIVEECNCPQPVPDHCFEFAIPERDERGKSYDGRYQFLKVSENNVRRFNAIIEYMMFSQLFAKMQLLDEQGGGKAVYGTKKEQILKFCDTFDPDEEFLNYDMVRVRYLRWRKNPESLTKAIL